MKRHFFLLSATALMGLAAAQVRMGNVIITTPSQQPSAAPRTAPARTANPAVPTGMQVVQGRIAFTGGPTSLPAGSSVTVTIEPKGMGQPLVHVSFKTGKLPTTYMVYFNPGRVKAGASYLLSVAVWDGAGNVMYESSSPLNLRAGAATAPITANVTVHH